MTRFGVAVLAGGQGLRIGGAKPSRRLGAASLLERATARAFSWGAPVVLVLRSPNQGALPGLKVLCDDPDIPGPLGGLRAAVLWAREEGLDAVLTLPCDMPFLPDDLPWRLAPGLVDGVDVVLAASEGRRHPICGLWRPAVLAAIDAQAALGKYALHGVAERVGHAEVSWPASGLDPFFNINSPEDMSLAERRLSGGAMADPATGSRLSGTPGAA